MAEVADAVVARRVANASKNPRSVAAKNDAMWEAGVRDGARL